MPYGPLFFIQKNLFKTFGIPSGFVRDSFGIKETDSHYRNMTLRTLNLN